MLLKSIGWRDYHEAALVNSNPTLQVLHCTHQIVELTVKF